MKCSILAGNAFAQSQPALLVFAHENERPPLPASLRGLLQRIHKQEFDGSEKQLLVLHTAGRPGIRAARLLMAGLGKRADSSTEKLRRATGLAVRHLSKAGIPRLVVQSPADAASVAAIVEAVVLATYKFTEFKSGNSYTPLQSLTLCVPPGTDLRPLKTAAHRAQLIADSANLARDLGNLPGNIIYPASLAERAREIAGDCGLKITVLDAAALRRGKFGGLLAVGSGSAREPRLIALEYSGHQPSTINHSPIALVGKAITFDTGGISIKPADKMDEMKFDKCGGCAVLGILRAVAKLQLPVNVLGVIAAAENMPGASSYRPGDIVTSYPGPDKRGVTIEVLNTDAEGRIVLGDALAYARERQPRAIVDFATLTGACVVALGNHAAGLLGNDDSLLETLRAAGERTGERCWPLPLWPEYRELVKSEVADHKNTGGRGAGAITAAAFLQKYVGDTPWAHLDIAGTAWTTEDRPYLNRGATGFGVRLLLDKLSAETSAPAK